MKSRINKKIFLFITSLLIFGVIIGVTYNILLSKEKINNNTNIETSTLSEINNNDLQEPINELINSNQDLDNSKSTINDLDNEIKYLKTDNTDYSKSINNSQKISNNEPEKSDTTKDIVDEKNLQKQKLLEEKENLEKELIKYTTKKENQQKLIDEKNNLKSIETKIKLTYEAECYNPDYDIEGANQKIKEYEEKLNLAKTEKEKMEYQKLIEKIENSIENHKTNKKKIEELTDELEQIEIKEKDLDNKISELELSEEEKTRYNEICNRIDDIKEELIKY